MDGPRFPSESDGISCAFLCVTKLRRKGKAMACMELHRKSQNANANSIHIPGVHKILADPKRSPRYKLIRLAHDPRYF